MKTTGILLLAMLLAACVPPVPDSVRLYVMDCGSLHIDDVSAFGLSNEETAVRDLFVPCYLVDHPDGRLLWDAGLAPSIVGLGDVEMQAGMTMRYDRSVIDQLGDIGLAPQDIEYIALSHMHFDHVGAANSFPLSHLLIQKAEYEAAFQSPDEHPVFNYDLYKELADNPRTILEGDHDVFGDSQVLILAAPGHTPGHQVLFVNLRETGPLVLSGDLYHFRFSRAHKRIPIFNTDAAQTVQSMRKIETFLDDRGATLWIEHDKALADTLKKLPLYYQ